MFVWYEEDISNIVSGAGAETLYDGVTRHIVPNSRTRTGDPMDMASVQLYALLKMSNF